MNRHRRKVDPAIVMQSSRWFQPRNIIIATQGVYSLNNLTFTILVAHFGGIADVGQAALYLSVTTVCMGVSRAIFIEPMLLSKRDEIRTDYILLVIAFAISLLATTCVAAALFGIELQVSLVLAGAAIVVQDYIRQVNFAAGKPGRTLAIDAFWLASLAAYFVTGLLFDGDSVFRAWLAASLSSLILGLIITKFTRPISGILMRVKKASSGLVLYSLLEALIFQSVFNFGVVLAFASFSLEAAGYYRLSASVLSPVGLVMVALATANFVAISRGVATISNLRRMSAAAGAATICVAATCLLALSLFQILKFDLFVGLSLLCTAILALQFPFYSASGPWSAYLKAAKARWSILLARVAGIPALALVVMLAFLEGSVSLLYVAIASSAGVQFGVDLFLSSRRFKSDASSDTVEFDVQ